MNLTDFDYELLSAYLDDALNGDERTRLEQRLATEPDLRRELNALRQTVALIKQLPPIKAPRDFTLTPAMLVAKPAPSVTRIRVLPLLASALSMAASLLIVFLGVALLLNIDTPTATPADEGFAALSTPTAAFTPMIALESDAAPTLATPVIQGAGTDDADIAGSVMMATEDPAAGVMMATEELMFDTMMAPAETGQPEEEAPPNARHFDVPETATEDPSAATMMEIAPFADEATEQPLPTITAIATQAPPMPMATQAPKVPTALDPPTTGDDLLALVLLSLGLLGFMTSVFLGVRAFRG
ncbi:MAG: hypothetical protein MUF87_16170 [Anaerolineae bacterium]|jgi:hypothetical protein|nr:hypothetical protein [Anaerolineae bacterium]